MFKGSIVALVTPMRSCGALDEASLEALLLWHLDQGTQGFVVCGTTGEAATLSLSERTQALRCVCKVVQKRVPVLVGTGTNATQASIEATQAAKDLGADGALVVTPYYNRPTQEGLFQHFLAVAKAVDFPILLYNVPARTACDLLPKTVIRLVEAAPNIVGIKEATGDLQRVAELKAHVPASFTLLSGDDATAMEFILQGGHGVISVTANMLPHLFKQMVHAAVLRDSVRAHVFNERLQPWYRRLTLEPNPIPIKWVLHQLGKIPEGIRLPLTPLSEVFQGVLMEALEQLEVRS